MDDGRKKSIIEWEADASENIITAGRKSGLEHDIRLILGII